MTFVLNFLVICLKIICFLIGLLLAVAYCVFFERKVIAYIQRRVGPNTTGPLGLLQPIADGIKLLNKETILPFKSYKILFLASPVLLFSLSVSSWAVIPFDFNCVFSNLNVGLLYILGISSLGVYSIIMAGFASQSRYALLGALRAASQMISYEISIGLIIVSVVMRSHSFNLTAIVMSQKSGWNIFYKFPIMFILWGIFFISTLAETNRSPFDLSEAETELVSGCSTEYSSFSYALFYLSEYANMILMSAVNTILFFGGWLPPFGITFLPGPFWFSLKVSFFLFLFFWIRATMPRFRYDQLMRLGWKVFLPLSLSGVVISSFLAR
jgi:NADH-quinone oxidoreductase subunit H